MTLSGIAYIQLPTHDRAPLLDGYRGERVITIDMFIEEVRIARSSGKRIIIMKGPGPDDEESSENESNHGPVDRTVPNVEGNEGRVLKQYENDDKAKTSAHKLLIDREEKTNSQRSDSPNLPAKFRRKRLASSDENDGVTPEATPETVSGFAIATTPAHRSASSNLIVDSTMNQRLNEPPSAGTRSKRKAAIQNEHSEPKRKRVYTRSSNSKPKKRARRK